MRTADRPERRVGLIGTGFMGETHVFGFAAAERVFDLPVRVVLHGDPALGPVARLDRGGAAGTRPAARRRGAGP